MFWFFAAGLAFGTLWCIGWLLAQAELDRQIGAFAEKEAGLGRIWRCGHTIQAGFPVALERRCAQLVLKNADFNVDVGSLHGEWSVFSPDHVGLSVQAPAQGIARDGQTFLLDWAAASGDVSGLLYGSGGGQMTFREPEARMGTDSGVQSVAAAELRIELGAPARPSGGVAAAQLLPVHLAVSGVKSADLAEALATSAPANLEFSGAISQLAALRGGTPLEQFESWRQAAGRLDINALHFVAGDLNVTAQGMLALDDMHRLRGDLTVTLAGGRALLAKLGYSPESSIVGGLLGGLLQAKAGKGAPPGLALPLHLADGHVFLGPFQMAVRLLPLY